MLRRCAHMLAALHEPCQLLCLWCARTCSLHVPPCWLLTMTCGSTRGTCASYHHSSLCLCPCLPAQVVLDQLYAEHGEDPSTWPKDVLASLGRRQAQLAQQVMPTTVPPA